MLQTTTNFGPVLVDVQVDVALLYHVHPLVLVPHVEKGLPRSQLQRFHVAAQVQENPLLEMTEHSVEFIVKSFKNIFMVN